MIETEPMPAAPIVSTLFCAMGRGVSLDQPTSGRRARASARQTSRISSASGASSGQDLDNTTAPMA
jgi:hypothetical protein